MNLVRLWLLNVVVLLAGVLSLYADDPENTDSPAAAAVASAPPLLPGRSKTGLPPEGYEDNALIPGQKWRVHDKARPEPDVVSPGTASRQQQAGTAPSDAVVLFDGTDLSQWTGRGGAAKWKVENGSMQVNGTGTISTRDSFGSCQLHVEYATPENSSEKSQGRGNSGIMLMGAYEIQVLDSFNNRTYSDGQAGAIYGQYPPLVNASRAPGQWQSFDIIFEAPAWDGDQLTRPAFVTVIHNGVLVHHRTQILGHVAHKDPPVYRKHAPRQPLQLQDHGNPIRFRNVWIRPLTGYDGKSS
ncbi:MAG: DUF1080 domain-containing protein [Planctomycetaceae bacterium]